MKIGPGRLAEFLMSESERDAFDIDVAPPLKWTRTGDQRVGSEWRVKHMNYYEWANIPWPATDKMLERVLQGHLSEREFEIIALANKVFPASQQPSDEVWCIDSNDEMRRHFGNIPDEPMTPERSLRNPWKGPLMMTLCGSSHIVIRYIEPYDRAQGGYYFFGFCHHAATFRPHQALHTFFFQTLSSSFKLFQSLLRPFRQGCLLLDLCKALLFCICIHIRIPGCRVALGNTGLQDWLGNRCCDSQRRCFARCGTTALLCALWSTAMLSALWCYIYI